MAFLAGSGRWIIGSFLGKLPCLEDWGDERSAAATEDSKEEELLEGRDKGWIFMVSVAERNTANV
jgi:hypothetical protein